MANRRMISLTIADSDAFLDLPLSAQVLYFHLLVRADDEGFITPKKIIRLVGCSQGDLETLKEEGFIYQFDRVVVIRHWKIHNTIQADRFTPTVYTDEKARLRINENKEYTLVDSACIQDVSKMDTECIQDVSNTETQYRLGKDSIGKNSLAESSLEDSSRHKIPPTFQMVKEYALERQAAGRPTVDPQRFFDYYESKGWMVGKGRMKDWQAAFRNWERTEKPQNGERRNEVLEMLQNGEFSND